MLHFYRTPGCSEAKSQTLLEIMQKQVAPEVRGIVTENCYNVATEKSLEPSEIEVLTWLLTETFEPLGFSHQSFLDPGRGFVFEVGPRMNFTTAWSTNAVSVCQACGLDAVLRIERSRRFLLETDEQLNEKQKATFLAAVHDRMTECLYPEPLSSFEPGSTPEPIIEIPVMKDGRAALEKINRELGLALDDWDLDYYTNLFVERIGRNPTNVECFDIAQSNSEHSRHWFFKGRLIIDDVEVEKPLMGVVQDPLKANPNNSVVAFNDNSSAIAGYPITTILPTCGEAPSPFQTERLKYDVLFTAETHNFPSGVAPFPGAETGTGGRIRDGHATGRGSLVVAGTAAYCVGNLLIPGYPLPWENTGFEYPSNLASPLQIEIEASNGASDYGNKFGEPVINGFTRSFGLRLPNGERREWIKPIMFSGGIGQIDARHLKKDVPEKDMLVVKVGGPAYRIGMGGGAASSMVQGENVAELDFNAVQRGDAEMEQKLNRVIRACVEKGAQNPIVSIHDQGAGGNCNVLKEIVEPEGARIDVRAIPVGDETLSVLEIWGAEYQENDALLLRPEHADIFENLCEREKVPFAFVGVITGDGKIVLYDSTNDSTPVDMELDAILGDMPQKTFVFTVAPKELCPLELPDGLTVRAALDRVLRLLAVGSKRFLTTKVDRSVTGLIARQQCVGPLQLTVADVAVIAQSHFGITGAATAIGEQPIKGLLDPAAMARMTVGESLTNLVWARVSALQDVRCSANWMWAAKLVGEGADLHAAAVAMSDFMVELGMAVDGGKDSISMAALAPDGKGTVETVKAPGTLVVSAYVTCPDITKTVTPDLKLPGTGCLLYVDLGNASYRLGGSALAQVYGQIGHDSPDVDPAMLGRAFDVVQQLVEKGTIRAGHDRSDGGLITTLLEMAFAGNCGIEIDLPDDGAPNEIHSLFSEELGLVIEVAETDQTTAIDLFEKAEIPCVSIGRTIAQPVVTIRHESRVVLEDDTHALRDLWEETSFELDRRQANPACVAEEQANLCDRAGPRFVVPFTPKPTPPAVLKNTDKIPIAILREEGSNGDREMASAFYAAGFEPWDVVMADLLNDRIRLDRFRGVVAVGGFSYADVLDSAKGWAGTIRFNDHLRDQFDAFYQRKDTFSLGICNGCQLLAVLGWVPWRGIEDAHQPRFIQNTSGRFESRFSAVQIQQSPSIMLRNMDGATLGIWVAHGEGRAFFPESELLEQVQQGQLAPIRYVDDNNVITEEYPFNPNGSPLGIAGLCSPDGRHLAMMPHPERAFLKWQWGWMSDELNRELQASPWLTMFQNARRWCEGTGG